MVHPFVVSIKQKLNAADELRAKWLRAKWLAFDRPFQTRKCHRYYHIILPFTSYKAEAGMQNCISAFTYATRFLLRNENVRGLQHTRGNSSRSEVPGVPRERLTS